MNHTIALLAYYGKTRLDLRETAHVLSMSYQTARHRRASGTFPVPMSGHPLTADIADLGRYLESLGQVHKDKNDER